MRYAYIVKDEENAFYLRVDFPAIRVYGNPLKFKVEICLGRVIVYKSYWNHIGHISNLDRHHHVVKRCVWCAGADPSKDDGGRFSTCSCDLVAVLFNIENATWSHGGS